MKTKTPTPNAAGPTQPAFPKLELHGLAIYTADGETLICQGADKDSGDEYHARMAETYEEAQRMMTLLAAAPDGLDVVRQFLAVFEPPQFADLSDTARGLRDFDAGELQDALRAARAFIVKATAQ